MIVSQRTIASALEELGTELGISEADLGGKVKLEGKDPVVASRHHLGLNEVMTGIEGANGMLEFPASEVHGVGLRESMLASPRWNARLRPEFDLPTVTSTGPPGEMSVLPLQVELPEFKLGPSFSGESNRASKLDWAVFSGAAPEERGDKQLRRERGINE